MFMGYEFEFIIIGGGGGQVGGLDVCVCDKYGYMVENFFGYFSYKGINLIFIISL